MNSGRYNTIFDHTSLRLHPDGTRVSEKRQHGKGRDRRVVQDSRGQLTAQDAGGWAPVKRTVRKRSEPTEEDNKDDEDDDTDEENEDEDEVKIVDLTSEKHLDEAEGETESENDGGRSGLKSSKAKHRREFVENLSFLDSTSRVAVAEDVAGPSEAKISLPSSDLLKSIHYFASTYYDEMGQLYDATRATRRDRKFRKQQMHQASVNAEGDEEEETEDQGQSRAPQRQNRQRKKTSRNIDMYKMLDGTALMAIGSFSALMCFEFAQLASRNARRTVCW
ncbi:hypothetical protein C8Q75DRAFT_504286 [Abortiporus biennis]|nr:hypothetical protein C8Q75DRAFT_504286 [Abortiporus biennis]